jgi:exodeoxyribonuclease-3
MLIGTWNINGLRPEILTYLEKFLEINNPGVLCLNETKKNEKDLKLMLGKFKKYNVIVNVHNPCQWHGVAVLIRKDIEFKEVDFKIGVCEPRDDNRSNDPRTGRLIAFEINDIVFVATYSPNSGKYLSYRINQWDKYLFRALEKTLGPIIWLGDINVSPHSIDVSDPKKMVKWAGFTPEERESFSNFMKRSKMIDIWRKQHPKEVKYSYRGSKGACGMRLDNIIVSPELEPRVVDSGICTDCDTSCDHVPVWILLE